MATPELDDARIAQWMDALEARHLADLRFAEVTRALRALSSAYVERRHTGATRSALDSAGKRAAFALFYAPLHLLTVAHVLRTLDAGLSAAAPQILDIGCGTGVAGAAWAMVSSGAPGITGIDRHPWAIDEARWTYAQLRVRGHAKTGDAARLPRLKAGDAIVAAYVLNEVPPDVRTTIVRGLEDAAGAGVRVLVLEPISRQVAPWWNDTARRLEPAGFRADEWRFSVALPPLVRKFDEAAGLDHRIVTVRTLYRA